MSLQSIVPVHPLATTENSSSQAPLQALKRSNPEFGRLVDDLFASHLTQEAVSVAVAHDYEQTQRHAKGSRVKYYEVLNILKELEEWLLAQQAQGVRERLVQTGAARLAGARAADILAAHPAGPEGIPVDTTADDQAAMIGANPGSSLSPISKPQRVAEGTSAGHGPVTPVRATPKQRLSALVKGSPAMPSPLPRSPTGLSSTGIAGPGRRLWGLTLDDIMWGANRVASKASNPPSATAMNMFLPRSGSGTSMMSLDSARSDWSDWSDGSRASRNSSGSNGPLGDPIGPVLAEVLCRKLREKADTLVTFFGKAGMPEDPQVLGSSSSERSLGGTSSSGSETVRLARLQTFPDFIASTLVRANEVRDETSAHADAAEGAFWELVHILATTVKRLSSILTDYQAGSKPAWDTLRSTWMLSRAEATLLKLSSISASMLESTYHPQAVEALKSVYRALRQATSAATTEKAALRSQLASYEAAGGAAFDSVAQEYGRLRKKIKERQWTLEQLTSSHGSKPEPSAGMEAHYAT